MNLFFSFFLLCWNTFFLASHLCWAVYRCNHSYSGNAILSLEIKQIRIEILLLKYYETMIILWILPSLWYLLKHFLVNSHEIDKSHMEVCSGRIRYKFIIKLKTDNWKLWLELLLLWTNHFICLFLFFFCFFTLIFLSFN